jgi:hypothetical protein
MSCYFVRFLDFQFPKNMKKNDKKCRTPNGAVFRNGDSASGQRSGKLNIYRNTNRPKGHKIN